MEQMFFGTGPVVGGKQAVQFRKLGPTTGQWLDMNGDHVAYAPVENITYESSTSAELFKQVQALRGLHVR